MHPKMQLVVVLLMAAAPHLHGQLPAGYYAGSTPLLPDSLRERYADGRFTVSVVRVARDSVDRILLARAEALMPPPDSIQRRAALVTGSGHVAAFEAAGAMAGERWWWREWDKVLLPYALTGAAVEHFVATVRTLAAGPNPFARLNQGVAHRANVDYTAKVESLGKDGSHRVTMQVRFGLYCGPLCALSFRHSRVVDFNHLGEPIKVEGDRPPSYLVS